MAGVAGHLARSAEVGPIDSVHHHEHPASSLFKRGVVCIPIPIACTFHDVAIRAVHAQGSREETHRPHEFVHGNPPEDLNVLEGFFRRFRLLIRASLDGLASCAGDSQEAQDYRSRGTTDRSPETELHNVSFPCRARTVRSRLAIEADRSLRELPRPILRPRISI